MNTTTTRSADGTFQSVIESDDLLLRDEIVRSKHKNDSHSHSRREQACIFRCLGELPAGSRVLDLPCGRGRLTRFLVERGYRVTAADLKESTVYRAREYYRAWRERNGGKPAPVNFEERNVLSTGFANDTFDGVTCIRLFHHFGESETRRRALGELRRICRGPIVVSFRNSFALDYGKFWFQDRARRYRRMVVDPYDCVMPISLKQFATEISDAGLAINHSVPVLWPVSSWWLLSLRRS